MSDSFSLKQYLSSRAAEVNASLEGFLPAQATYMGNIGETMRYAVFPGGKRFRPVLTLAAADALGVDHKLAMPCACAFELIHCFSLVHDDLPCMDNDTMRRGKPTCHVAYGEDAALLAGDALSIYAFDLAARTPVKRPESLAMIIRELAFAAGYPGMVGGQILDMDSQHHGADKASLLAVHQAKTGALIRGAVRVGAMVGEASEDELRDLTTYGEKVGLVFQITDDILDAQDDPDPVSFPTIYGMETSKLMAREATEVAVKSLQRFGSKAQPLQALAEYLLYRTV